MTSVKYEVKELVKYFFKNNDSSNKFKCNNCGKHITQNIKNGYTNLKNHLIACIGSDYGEIYLEKGKDSDNTLHKFGIVNNNIRDTYKWIEWVVMRNIPLMEVDNPLTRKMMESKRSISSKSIRKYMLQMVPLVEKVISNKLPEFFALMFDGWTKNDEHFVAVFAVYSESSGIFNETLLAISAFEYSVSEDVGLTAKHHEEFFKDTLLYYNKTIHNVLVLIGDNCNTNRRIATNLNIQFSREILFTIL